MGTSSSRRGPSDKRPKKPEEEEEGSLHSNAYKSLKRTATSFYNGSNIGVGSVINKFVIAIGGSTNFCRGTFKKRRHAIRGIFTVFSSAVQYGLAEAFAKENIEYNRENHDSAVVELVNKYYPESISSEDVCNREFLLHAASGLFGAISDAEYNKVQIDFTSEIVMGEISSVIANYINSKIEDIVGFGLERNNDPTLADENRKELVRDIEKRVYKHLSEINIMGIMLSPTECNIDEIFEKLLNDVLAEYEDKKNEA